jgi:hypothetical protein
VLPGPTDTAADDSAIETSTGGFTVTTVDLGVEVATPDAASVAMIVALAPTLAVVRRVTTPSELTAATALFDDANISPDAASVLVEPSL